MSQGRAWRQSALRLAAEEQLESRRRDIYAALAHLVEVLLRSLPRQTTICLQRHVVRLCVCVSGQNAK